jgi:undecaprenyl-diphosphatase
MFEKLLKKDAELFRRVNAGAGRSLPVDWFAVVCSRWLLYPLFAVPFVMAHVYWAEGPSAFRTHAVALATAGVRGLLAALAAFVGNWAFSCFAFRKRPYLAIRGEHMLVPPPWTARSFPSSHSSAAFALAFSVAIVDPVLGGTLLAAAVTVAWGRVFTGVHYPLDVAAGLIVGFLWALFFCVVGIYAGDFGVVAQSVAITAWLLK